LGSGHSPPWGCSHSWWRGSSVWGELVGTHRVTTLMKASVPILIIAGIAGVWLGCVLLVLRFFGIPLS
jgi:hypothetical protein